MNFKNNLGFIIYILIAFSQVVLSFEVLSLFKLISVTGILVLNISFFILSVILWVKNQKYIYVPKIKEETIKIFKALKQDKLLIFASVCFLIFFISMFIMALFYPVTYGDALGYYLSRCTMWIQNASIAHYITTDSRELIMPVNAELLYSWILLFMKNETGIGIFPFILYVNAIYVIYNFLGELSFCRRKRLWSIFVFSSFALVYVESAIPGGDLLVGSLMLACIYLFFCACKSTKISIIYFSALAYSLAIGTKTTAIIALPMIFVLLFIIGCLYNKKNFKKYIFTFILFLIINFLIFSSYNYILNFIDFSNPVSNREQLLLNRFRGGIRGYLSNLIKYTFVMFDFSGIIDVIGAGKFIENMQDKVLALIGANKGTYTSTYFGNFFAYTPALGVADSSLGVTGFLAFYPALIYSVFWAIKKRSSKKVLLLASLACFYIFNILIFSGVMVFTRFNMRYLLAFAVVASPVIVYTYIKKNINVYKIVICWFIFVYLAFNAHAKPLMYIYEYFKHRSLPSEFQIKDRNFILEDNDEFRIIRYFKNQNKCNIGIMLYQIHSPVYYIQKLRLYGFEMETILPEFFIMTDLSKYSYVIVMKDTIASTLIRNYRGKEQSTNCFYKDWQGNIIKNYEEDTPVMVICDVPYNVFFESGFEPVKDIYLKNYIIFKNVRK